MLDPVIATAADPTRLSPATRMGAVSLTVSDLPRVRTFYETALGLQSTPRPDGSVSLAAGGGPALVELHGDGVAPPRDPRAPGLFHLAILLPSRPDLADALARLARVRWPLTGASDHLVSEALYLSDPEGNGIELYRDRPAADWPRDEHGGLTMGTLRLDLRDLLADADTDEPRRDDPAVAGSIHAGGMPAGTRMGHVHLQVADIPRAEAFYADVLGFEPTVRGYPGALFASAGGYHHHVGLNTWNSAGASPATPGAAGLRHFEVVVADHDELHRVIDRLRAAGAVSTPATDLDGPTLVTDPFGIRLALRAA